MTVIENSLIKCLINIHVVRLSVFPFKFNSDTSKYQMMQAYFELLMKAAKKCNNFLLEVTIRICKVLFCYTKHLLNSVKIAANLLQQQQKITGQIKYSH